MPLNDPETERLLEGAARGDSDAENRLLTRYRQRLRKMIAFRLDKRLQGRVDPSDVVQEALADASKHLEAYLKRRPLPFYPWLRQFASDRIAELYRRHIRAERRSVDRETRLDAPPADPSAAALTDQLMSGASSPLRHLLRKELRDRVRMALEQLAEGDREVLVLRHLEEMSVAEAAAVLGVSEAAARSRHFRAAVRLRGLLGDLEEDRP
jgi:RNA polymerase sigma-70 factor (ECF subfamily)